LVAALAVQDSLMGQVQMEQVVVLVAVDQHTQEQTLRDLAEMVL